MEVFGRVKKRVSETPNLSREGPFLSFYKILGFLIGCEVFRLFYISERAIVEVFLTFFHYCSSLEERLITKKTVREQ